MFNALRERIFGIKTSQSQAKSRLHLVLVQDRSGLSGDEMSDFRLDLLNVLKKYFVISDSGLEVSYQRESASTTLMINSPVLRRKPTILPSNKDTANKNIPNKDKNKVAVEAGKDKNEDAKKAVGNAYVKVEAKDADKDKDLAKDLADKKPGVAQA